MGSQWRERQWRERQWKHNLETAETLRRSREDRFADWEVTMRFCAVMSLVNGGLERHGLAFAVFT